jgi:VanZ family protein
MVVAYAARSLRRLGFRRVEERCYCSCSCRSCASELEIAQLAVPQRSSDIADALADLAGASMVLLPVLFVRWCATP